MNLTRYQAFLNRFGTTTRHLLLNEQNSCLGSEAVHRTQHKLHLLDPDIFPLLKDVSVPAVWSAHPPLPKSNSPLRLKGLEDLKNKVSLLRILALLQLLFIDFFSKLRNCHYLWMHDQNRMRFFFINTIFKTLIELW